MKKILTIFFFVVFLFSSCKKEQPESDACFTYTTNGAIIVFDPGCSKDATDFDWDFGDGQTRQNCPQPLHQYANPGNFQVSLTITKSNGTLVTTKKSVSIAQVCRTCTYTLQGTSQSNSSTYCGTLQSAESFCNSCQDQPPYTSSCQ